MQPTKSSESKPRKITASVDEQIFWDVKAAAAQSGKQIKQWMAEAVVEKLERDKAAEEAAQRRRTFEVTR